MGKRKKSSRTPQGPKKREPLATTFQCLFCNHEKSVTVKLLKKEGVGQLSCRVCGQSYQTGINYLSAAVDVYSDWIDACEAVAPNEATDTIDRAAETSYRDLDAVNRERRPIAGGETGGAGAGAEREDDLDGFIDNDEGDAEAAYVDE